MLTYNEYDSVKWKNLHNIQESEIINVTSSLNNNIIIESERILSRSYI